jgi:predicted dehydrogenase
MSELLTEAAPPETLRHPRLGFSGVGEIGRSRMQAIAERGAGSIVALWDDAAGSAVDTAAIQQGVDVAGSFDDLLAMDLDGVLIATPSTLHATQAVAALERGIAVFCQKPLGFTAAETRRVIDAAKRANVLLGVDLPYRHTAAMRVLRSTVQAGELGDVYAVDTVFYSATGPDRSWAGDPALAAGGCVLDLGMHMVDLALWTLGFPRVTGVASALHAAGERVLPGRTTVVEDHAVAMLDLDTGATVRLACSWNLPVGEDARIEATFYGTEGAGSFRNVGGSFNDFTAELFRGAQRHTLAAPPDAWVGRNAVAWADALARGQKYDAWVEGIADVADAVDRVLGR